MIKISKNIIEESQYDIDKLAESIGCNLTQLSNIIGVDVSQISKIRNGKLAITDKFLKRILDAIEDYKAYIYEDGEIEN